MAYSLSSSPSSSLSRETHLFCNSLSPPDLFQLRTHKNLNFPLKTKSSLRISSSLSLQELNANADEKGVASSKSHVWVNPKSPRASKLRQKSYDFRYASLVKLAESLNSCSPVEEDVCSVLNILGDSVVEQDAVIILNNMSNPETALVVLNYFQKRLRVSREVVLYNVTLKVFRKCKDLNGAESLFSYMLEKGVKPDNVTFSTIISCARQCSLPEKAVEWFEKMPSFGCEPDEVTCSVMVDAYGRVGNVDVALSLYDRARSEKWRLDAVTFSTLIRIYGSLGNFDGCLNLYEEMKALGVRGNASVYNSLLDGMGRAKRPWQAKNIYREMVNSGIEPTWGTYAALIRAYGRARYGEDALGVYREMKEKGLEVSVVLYNTLLSTCADVGFTDEALEIFQDMKSSGTCSPDSWTFASLITIFSCSGKVEEAEATLAEMLEAGFEPNIFVLTSLVQCYGKAGRTDDVVRTFDRLLELGITPDERFCGCLLNVLTQAPNEELDKLTGCIEKANPKLGHVVKLLVHGENIEREILRKEASELFESIVAGVRKAYCNCLIDLCVNQNQLERACELLDLGLALEIYTELMSRTPTQWSLHLKSLSLGAALTALHIWMNDLTKALENGEELPSLLGINTGHGKHKFSEKGLAGVFESHLKELNAPFHEAPDKVGWFLTTKVAATSWLESRRSHDLAAA
ncbi:Pentatricopeptide repeat-containing protein, chloroplastic [Sesamum alatum]|uniref:Pentatricopeptide repeat-containing protein, chloroplastic n=1 Tax=Sesamum alatum TaxID=300844 RepID=A0AAE1YQH9_9LAMI|nr:Pentatricopeptide repeat-containing protein, chloroplastic [Sesamum alatum]